MKAKPGKHKIALPPEYTITIEVEEWDRFEMDNERGRRVACRTVDFGRTFKTTEVFKTLSSDEATDKMADIVYCSKEDTQQLKKANKDLHTRNAHLAKRLNAESVRRALRNFVPKQQLDDAVYAVVGGKDETLAGKKPKNRRVGAVASGE